MTEKKIERTSKIIVNKIIADLTDRRGLRQEWEQIDKDIQNEIKEDWNKIVKKDIITAIQEFLEG